MHVHLRRCEFGLGGRDVGLCGADLRFGLPHVLDAGRGLHDAQLRLGLGLLGAGARQRQVGVGGIQHRDEVTLRHLLPFGNAAFEQPARHLRGHLHLGRLDLARHADTVGGGRWRAGSEPEEERDDKQG